MAIEEEMNLNQQDSRNKTTVHKVLGLCNRGDIMDKVDLN